MSQSHRVIYYHDIKYNSKSTSSTSYILYTSYILHTSQNHRVIQYITTGKCIGPIRQYIYYQDESRVFPTCTWGADGQHRSILSYCRARTPVRYALWISPRVFCSWKRSEAIRLRVVHTERYITVSVFGSYGSPAWHGTKESIRYVYERKLYFAAIVWSRSTVG